MWSHHSAHFHQLVRPNLAWVQEICLIPLIKGQVFLVPRGRKRLSWFRVPPPWELKSQLTVEVLVGFDIPKKCPNFQRLAQISRDMMHKHSQYFCWATADPWPLTAAHWSEELPSIQKGNENRWNQGPSSPVGPTKCKRLVSTRPWVVIADHVLLKLLILSQIPPPLPRVCTTSTQQVSPNSSTSLFLKISPPFSILPVTTLESLFTLLYCCKTQ